MCSMCSLVAGTCCSGHHQQTSKQPVKWPISSHGHGVTQHSQHKGIFERGSFPQLHESGIDVALEKIAVVQVIIPGRAIPFMIQCLSDVIEPDDRIFMQQMHKGVIGYLKYSAQRVKGNKHAVEPQWDAEQDVQHLLDLCKIGC